MTPHHAIVLAAGRGIRLGDLTTERPKCLVPVLGRPLLDWQMAALGAAGIDTVGIVRGYQGQMLERPDVVLFDNPRWAETNMVRSLMCAAEWLRQYPCVVSYADLIYVEATVRHLADADADLAITFDRNWQTQWEARFGDPLVDAETFAIDQDNRVTDIGRKPTHLGEINGQYMGLLKFTPRGWAQVEALLGALEPAVVDRLDMTSLLQRLIVSGVHVHGVGITDPWFEVDSAADLAACETALSHLRRP
jgi:choline kinase